MDNKLKAQRANISKFIAYCEAVMTMPEPNLSKGYLDAKNKIITEFWAKLDGANDEIIQSDEEYDQSPYITNNEFEKAFTMYDKVSIRIQNKLEKYEKPPTQLGPVTLPENMVLNTNGKSQLKLKPVNIPTFSGDYKKWLSFRSLFDSMVHNNGKIDDLERMHYLKSCVADEAEDLISQFDVTAESYREAYEVITGRFHNEVILVDTHIMDLLSQPNLSSESSTAIKTLVDVTSNTLRALKTLKIDTSTWDPILLLLLVQKLDRSTRRLWEQTLKPKVRPSMNEFLEFLGTRFHALGCQQKFNFTIDTNAENPKTKHWKNKKPFGNEHGYNDERVFPPRIHQNFHNTAQDARRKCPFGCGENHSVTECESFRKVNVTIRNDLVNGVNLCKNCLKNHPGKCSLRPGCMRCGRYHHTLLHPEEPNSRTPEQTSSQQHVALQNHHTHTKQDEDRIQLCSSTDETDTITWDEPVLLATAIVLVRSSRDKLFYPFRALLDQASEASYVTENVVQFLGLKKQSVTASTSGLGGVTTSTIDHIVDFELGSKRNSSFIINVQAPVTKKISNPLPSTRIPRTDWDHIKDLQLADPEFNVPGRIDLLLGAPIYGYLLLPGLIKISPTIPVAQNTEFGWILSGGVRSTAPIARNLTTFHLKLELEDQLRKFFEQEEVSKERVLTKEETECENFFEQTIQRNEEGRYVVALPFKGDPESLGSSKGQAFSRLMKLESKLETKKELKEEYNQILNEYESMGHISVVGKFDKASESTSYYLPHHAVFKPDSTTTKTRIVFDASAKTTSGFSLNDLLMTGPTLQQDLVSILLRWRLYLIVFAADIAKMYRQVMVRKEDRKFQRFLWRKNLTEPIMEYEHNMVTFGVTSATYLAVKALQHLAKEHMDAYPEAAAIVLRDFYMDDGMSGADNVEQAIKICKNLKELLGKGEFPLRKFISNSAEVLESLPEDKEN